MKASWVQAVVVAVWLAAASLAAPGRACLVDAPFGFAQGKQDKPAGWACAEGIEVHFRPERPAQGAVVLVEVQATEDVKGLRGHWSGETVHFWSEGEGRGPLRALIGVDLSRAPGKALLKLTAERAGRPVECGVILPVEKTEFAEERLRVSRRFVELSPEDQERAKQEAERLREIFAGVTPGRLWAGAFASPVEGVKARGNFGTRRILNNQPRSPHAGEDFSAPAGAPVRAAQRGRVALADDLFFSGQTVVLDHGLGLFTYYAHLERIEVKEGELVEAGTVLGRVGATGRVTGAHLHWAARVGRARVNPLELIAVTNE